jgi:hypothetical protein
LLLFFGNKVIITSAYRPDGGSVVPDESSVYRVSCHGGCAWERGRITSLVVVHGDSFREAAHEGPVLGVKIFAGFRTRFGDAIDAVITLKVRPAALSGRS